MDILPYGRQWISEDDVRNVVNVLRSDFLTGGPKVEEFEKQFADLVGAEYAVAMNSATSALHVSMLVAGIGPGHRVLTSPNTFLASANCAAFVGATPDFVDINPVSYNIDASSLEAGWQQDVKAVVAVDYAGQACDMPQIAECARQRGAIVIEDACHAVGGQISHQGEKWPIGGHPWADMTIFSFHPVKTITSGEGGVLVTSNKEWAKSARRFRSHGIVREDEEFVGLGSNPSAHLSELSETGPWYYEMQDLGFNYRITDIQCALGLSQLSRLEGFVARRREIVARYNAELSDLDWLTPPDLLNPANRNCTSWHLYTVLIDFNRIKKTRTEVMTELRRLGVGTQVLYIPIYLQPWYRRSYGYVRGKCPRAEEYYAQCLSLPLYPSMSDSDVKRVTNAVRKLSSSSL